MIKQNELHSNKVEQKKAIRQLIKQGKITLAGNHNLKIYGTLHCASGKRMKARNRVFFRNETEALEQGYRPCSHCLPEKYKK